MYQPILMNLMSLKFPPFLMNLKYLLFLKNLMFLMNHYHQ